MNTPPLMCSAWTICAEAGAAAAKANTSISPPSRASLVSMMVSVSTNDANARSARLAAGGLDGGHHGGVQPSIGRDDLSVEHVDRLAGVVRHAPPGLLDHKRRRG